MENKTIAKTLSLITLCVSIHYFFSLNFLVTYLASFDLDYLDVLSFEDIQFTMASFNIKFFILLAFIIIVIPLVNTIANMTNKIDKTVNEIAKRIAEKSKTINYIMFVILLVVLITLLLILIIPINPWISIFLSVVSSVFIYYIYKDKWLSIICFIFLMFTFVYGNVRDVTKNTPLFNNKVQFELTNGKTVTSDNKDHKLIFWGSKYIILQNGKNSIKLYPTSEIQEIEWHR